MATPSNPLDMPEDTRDLYNKMAYHNFNGVEREVEFMGAEVRLEHGLGFTPDLSRLTVRVHVAFADIGQIWLTKADDRYVYVNAPRAGRARLEITHPPQDSR